MASIRTIGLASALLLLLPVYVWAAPDPTDPWSLLTGPDPNDPTSLLVEGGARQYANVSHIDLVQPPVPHVQDPNTTVGREQLVEGHTTFAVITIRDQAVQDNGSVDVGAVVDCSAETHVNTTKTFFGIPVPTSVDSTTAQCVENATLVAVPDPIPFQSSVSPLRPDGVVLRYQTPGGQVGYETEYAFEAQYVGDDGAMHNVTRYAWATTPTAPWTTSSGAVKDLYITMPLARLQEMGARSFHVVDARTLPGFD